MRILVRARSAKLLVLLSCLMVSVRCVTLRAGLDITASAKPLAPPPGHPSVLVHHATDDKGGNTSLRFMANRKVDANKYPTHSVTVFGRLAREQPQRDRDLGQTFLTGDQGGQLDALFLRVGHADLAVLTHTPGARVAVQWFEVTGPPRLNDHGTPGFAGTFDRVTSPELDDHLEGEAYTPLRVVEGRLPAALHRSDYLKLDFTGADEFRLEPGRAYAFLLMFLDRAPQRGMTLANEYYGTYTPDLANKFRGHALRREGRPAFPDDWKARLAAPPGTLGFPDVCTFRDLHFAVTVAPAVASGNAALPGHTLAYAPAPPDNPLKGFVPYLRADATFPHSLEWDYTRLADVMTGPTHFNWAPFEAKLSAAASRGHQFVARFYLEWPGKKTGVPQYLIDAGLLMRRWTNTNTQPFPPAVDHTPDYEDPRLRAALTNFIHALGRRYDGDPRLGFVGLGLLGTWGEWHNYPNDQWFASKTVQCEVMDAYEAAFKRTKLVARYPAGTNDYRYAHNGRRAIGYHDDSFAWATVHTGRKSDDWFFETRLRSAGALAKWRTQPIGGEVRPEVWECLFDEPSCAPQGQEFDRCLAVTHASWLCHEGVFRGQIQGRARERALRAVQRMGYELHVARADVALADSRITVALTVTNTGVAPFYYDWPVELAALDRAGQLTASWTTDWTLTGIVPGEPAMTWRSQAEVRTLAPGAYHLLLRVPHPLPNGPPLRFANTTQDQHRPGWLTLGEFRK